MLDIFAYSPRCETNNDVLWALLLMNLMFGLLVVWLISKNRLKTAGIIVAIILLTPLFLWVIDGSNALAQSSLDPDYSVCNSESLITQLANSNYGVWISLVVMTGSTVIGFVVKSRK